PARRISGVSFSSRKARTSSRKARSASDQLKSICPPGCTGCWPMANTTLNLRPWPAEIKLMPHARSYPPCRAGGPEAPRPGGRARTRSAVLEKGLDVGGGLVEIVVGPAGGRQPRAGVGEEQFAVPALADDVAGTGDVRGEGDDDDAVPAARAGVLGQRGRLEPRHRRHLHPAHLPCPLHHRQVLGRE